MDGELVYAERDSISICLCLCLCLYIQREIIYYIRRMYD